MNQWTIDIYGKLKAKLMCLFAKKSNEVLDSALVFMSYFDHQVGLIVCDVTNSALDGYNLK